MKIRFRSQPSRPEREAKLRAWLPAALWLLALGAVAPCMAQNTPTFGGNSVPNQPPNPIQLSIDSPIARVRTTKQLSPQVRVGRWLPLAVDLTNSGDAVQGRLTLRLSSSSWPDKPPLEYFSDVDLPARQAHKRVWLYGLIQRADIDRAEVELAGRDIKTIQGTFLLTGTDVGTRVVATISDGGKAFPAVSFLNSARDPGLVDATDLQGGTNVQTSSQVPARALAYSGHDLVPNRWIGLDAADAVVLGDLNSPLERDQVEALRGYVSGGGTLVVFGGDNVKALAQSPLHDLWPMNLSSSATASAGEVSGLVRQYVEYPYDGVKSTYRNISAPGDNLSGAPVRVARGTLVPGAEVLAGTSEAPLVAARDSGAGRVVLVAFDPTQQPFLGWRGNAKVWAQILNNGAHARRLPNLAEVNAGYSGSYNSNGYASNSTYQGDGNSLMSALVTAPQLRTPPVSAIAWFLALYVFVLVPLNYCVLRFFDRRELAWITVPVIVVGFSVMSYAAALNIKGSDVLTRHIAIVQGSANSATARTDALLWLFSPRKTTYQLSSDDANMVVGNYQTAGDDTSMDAVRESGNASFALDGSPINMWSYRTYAGQSVVRMGQGISVENSGGATIIKNNTSFDLRGVTLVSNGAVLGYGDVHAGGSSKTTTYNDGVRSIDTDMSARIGRASGLDQLFGAGGDINGQANLNLAQATLNVALGQNFGKNNPGSLLVAWGTKPLATLKSSAEAPHDQSVTLFVFRLPNAQYGDKTMTREAVVRPAGVASAASPSGSPVGSDLYYDCQLPASSSGNVALLKPGRSIGTAPWATLQIMVRGNGYSWSSSGGRSLPPAGVQVWDDLQGQWRNLVNNAGGGVSDGTWNFSSMMTSGLGTHGPTCADVVRSSDGVIRLRIHTTSPQIGIGVVRVVANSSRF